MTESDAPPTDSNLKAWPANKIERWTLDRIKPYPNNPMLHSDAQVRQLAESMKRFGVTTPVLVDDDGELIYGHGRVLAAQSLGYTELPVAVARGWTEDEKKAYRIADNQLSRNSEWNLPVLRAELGALKATNFDLPVIGFDKLQMVQFLAGKSGEADPEETPELPPTPCSKLGDTWILGSHRVRCGDSTNAEDVAVLLAGAKPHLMVTDPPYGVKYDPEWRNRDYKDARTASKATGIVQNDDKANWEAAYKLFDGDVIYAWSTAGSKQLETALALTACDFEIRQQIIWVKQHFVISRGNYHYRHEPCWYAVRKGRTAHWCGARDKDTVWDIANASAMGGKKDDTTSGHGTQKPIECMKRPIENNSKPGDSIYEPFAGSGTTVIAAEMTSRIAYAMELSPAYVDVIIRRWQGFTGQEAHLESTGQLFSDVCAERGVVLIPRAQEKSAPTEFAEALANELDNTDIELVKRLSASERSTL